MLIGLKATSLLVMFGCLRSLGFKILSLPLLYASLVSILVSIASHPSINIPKLLGKNPDGTFPVWALIMFSPYLYFVRFFSDLRRLSSGEDPYNEIVEGLYVGGWPYSPEKIPPGNPAIVDCTCELPRIVKGNSYLCVPTWDTRAPDPSEIESAVKWACRMQARGVPVFIHCAYGHGRSVAVMCALLVAVGAADDWKNAEKLIKQKRPYIRMNSLHRKALDEWSKHRLSTPKPTQNSALSSVLSNASSRG